jgi:hypothetical protein
LPFNFGTGDGPGGPQVKLVLAGRDELLSCYLMCQQLEVTMKARQAGGGKSSGWYKKHDTARNRCLQRCVYPGLAMSKLPTAENAKMLFDLPRPADFTGRS